jgi:hypothetical protein
MTPAATAARLTRVFMVMWPDADRSEGFTIFDRLWVRTGSTGMMAPWV